MNSLSLSLYSFIHQRGSHLPSDCLIIKDTEGYERGGRRVNDKLVRWTSKNIEFIPTALNHHCFLEQNAKKIHETKPILGNLYRAILICHNNSLTRPSIPTGILISPPFVVFLSIILALRKRAKTRKLLAIARTVSLDSAWSLAS